MADSTPKRGLLSRIYAPFGMLLTFPFSSHLQRYGRLDGWTAILTISVVVLTTIFFTSCYKSLHPSFDTRPAKTVAAGPIYNDFLTDDGKSIGSVRRGEEVELVAYGSGYFLVQTKSGERGWVDASVIDRTFVVASHDYDEAPLGSTCTFVRYVSDNHFEVVARTEYGAEITFYNYDLFPTAAYALPSLGLDDSFSRRYVYVTERWMDKHFVEGRTYEDMCDRYYGFPVVVDLIDAQTKKVLFPVRVKDFDTNRFHPKVTALFVNDKLVNYELTEDGKIPFVERFIPLGGRIASTRLFIKLRSRPFLIAPRYEALEDVVEANKKGKSLSKWIRIPIIVLLVVICYMVLMAHLMVSPVVGHLIDRIAPIPDFISKRLFIFIALFGLPLLYLIYTPHWTILALVFFFGYGVYRGLAKWEIYSYCDTCHKFHTLRTVGWGKARESHYDEVVHHKTEEVTKRGDHVVSRRTVGGYDEVRHHVTTSQDEYLICDNCQQKYLFHHVDNTIEGGEAVDEWPSPNA